MLNKTPFIRRRYVRRAMHFGMLLPVVLTVAILAAAILWGPSGASAQSLGTPRELSTRAEIVDFLGQTYDEAPVAGGIASNGSVLEVFTSPDGNSWTIILTSPDGTSHVMAAGETWLELLKLKGERI